MQFLTFALTYPFVWLISRLPMRILYGIADIFYFFIFYVFGYRKKVVLQNLQLAFPNKTDEERKSIAKKFFRHFMDIIIESVKTFSISEKEILRRYQYKNPELVDKYIKEGKSIALVGAHQGNWEWSTSMALILDIKCFGTYTKIKNKYFDKVIKKSRGRFKGELVKTSKTIRNMQANFSNKKQAAYILLSDQSPQVSKTFYWRDFFNIKVPVHTGAEMLSKRFNFVVINYSTKKIKRGYYETEFELITENPKEHENYNITDKYIEITEKNIQQQPEFYLWSHRRFKHRNKVPKEFL